MIELLRRLYSSFVRCLSNSRGADVVDINATTATNLANAIPEHWDTKIRLDAIKQAFWGKRFEGPQGSRMPIIMNTDFTKMSGDIIHFQTMKRLKKPGVTGASTLTGNEETLTLGQFDLTVEWLRHAVGFNKRGTKRANFDAVRAAGVELADWMARQIDDSMFKELISTRSPDTVFAGGVADEDSLDSSTSFNVDTLDRIKVALQRKGAIPFQVKTVNGVTLKFYAVVIDPIDAFNLRADEAWFSSQRDGNMRGLDNPIFTGAMGLYNGLIIFEFSNVRGEQGTFLRPEATLSADIGAAGAVTVTVTTDSATAIDATKFFADDGNIQIGDEVMAYTAKSVNTYTVAAGGRGQLGTVSQAHVSGDLVTQRNISTQVCFGAEIAVRGWGMFPKATKEVQDYGFRFGVGIESIFGQRAIDDSAGNVPNYLLSKSFAENPNASI